MAEPRFFYSVDGSEQNGPVSVEDLRQLFAQGTLSEASYLCQEGDTSWERLNPEFFTAPPETEETEPPTAEPAPAEAEAPEPETIEPAAIEPEVSEPAVEQTEAMEPALVESETFEPAVMESETAEPAALGSAAAESAEFQEAEPAALEPEAFEPAATELETVAPEAAEPGEIELAAAVPEPTPVQSSFLDSLDSPPAELPPVEPDPVPLASWQRSLQPPPAQRKPPAPNPPQVPVSAKRSFEPPPVRKQVVASDPPSVPTAAQRSFGPPPPKRKPIEPNIATFPVSSVRSLVPPSVEPVQVERVDSAPAVFSPPHSLQSPAEPIESLEEEPLQADRAGNWMFDAITCLIGLGLAGWMVYGQFSTGDHRTPSFLLVFFVGLLFVILLLPWLITRFLVPRRWRSPAFAVVALLIAGAAAFWSFRPHPIVETAVQPPAATVQVPAAKEDPNDPRIASDLHAVSAQLEEKIKETGDAAKACNFAPSAFNGPADITSRRMAIATLYRNQEDVVAFLQNIGDHCRDALAADNFSESMVLDAAIHFRQANHVDLLIPFWQAQAKLSSDRMARFDFLAKNPTSWSVKDGKLLFVDSASVASYTVFADALQADAKSIEDAQKSMTQ